MRSDFDANTAFLQKERAQDYSEMSGNRDFALGHAKFAWQKRQDMLDRARQFRLDNIAAMDRSREWRRQLQQDRWARQDRIRSTFDRLRAEQQARIDRMRGRTGYSVGGRLSSGSAGSILSYPAGRSVAAGTLPRMSISHPGSQNTSNAYLGYAGGAPNNTWAQQIKAIRDQGYTYQMQNPATLDPNDARFKFSKSYYNNGDYMVDPSNPRLVWVKGPNATTSGAPIRQY